MKYAGLLVMPAGFFLTIAALLLFPAPAPRAAFVVCGLAVEGMGLAVAVRGHMRAAGRGGHEPQAPCLQTAFALALGLLLLAPLALAGVALINTGLGRSRSAAQSLLGSLAMVSVAFIVFTLVGATFADGAATIGQRD